MENVRIQFASVAVALLYCVPVWSQTATLTGYVLEKKGNTPINGARVSIVNSSKLVLSNSEGKYSISGLTRGQKVSVTYAADGYGIPPLEEVPLDSDPTEHTVHLYKDIALQVYWMDVSRGVERAAGQKQPQDRLRVYEEAWKGVEGSTLSAEAKSSAAHAFATELSAGALASQGPGFQAYSTTDLNSILKAKDEFGNAIDGNVKLQGQAPAVPGNVAADVAAQQILRRKHSAEIPAGFLQDFKGIYGDNAAAMLKNNVTVQSQTSK